MKLCLDFLLIYCKNMPHCSVLECSNNTKNSGSFYSYFSFPSDPEIRVKWLRAIGRDINYLIVHERVCSEHFTKDVIIKEGSKRLLKKGAIPSLNIPLPHNIHCTTEVQHVDDKSRTVPSHRNTISFC
uniref:THAP-type domain-containing protein n=1 Tax=Photinus pyralis TaxID=7054 RepID=A0A1Y1K167_PHOPY